MTKKSPKYDVIVVGAGAAGVGVGVTLKHLGVVNFTIVDRHEIGASFMRWPAEMRFISPSFIANGFGLMDLNAVAIGTSPAYSLHKEHPSGKEFAGYLRGVAKHFDLPVQSGIDVACVRKAGRTFYLETTIGELRSRFVIWAAGEFQYPRLQPFPGAELCCHNATIESWQSITGDEVVVIGGYESGIDAAVNLVRLGKTVRVLDKTPPWDVNDPDPSLTLSPYTLRRLQTANRTHRLQLLEAVVTRVERNGAGFVLYDQTGERLHTPIPP
ncbi:MAG: NAD(P)-binding domain-containing protein, partial [Chloroflexota bacterium]|nr:NAD(P)-binding domain-containing protein [Chloroflexota bacterium]